MRFIFGVIATSILFLAGTPASADFSNVLGDWQSETILLDPPNSCAPSDIKIKLSGSANKVSVKIKAGDAISLDATLATGKDGKVFVEESGWMSQFGFGDESTRDDLIANKPVIWARETGTGAIIYRSQISKNGALEVLRLALEPVDGAITATIALTSADCIIDPFTTSLTKS